MGQDKALLRLAGKPLVEHAVVKLSRIAVEVGILGNNPALGEYAVVIPDLHAGCGPIGGIEAALARARQDWALIVPVDVPFLPTALLDWWARTLVARSARGARLAMFRVGEIPQPALLMIHRELAPWIAAAVLRGSYKLYPVLEAAARELAGRRGIPLNTVVFNLPWDEHARVADRPYPGDGWWRMTVAQRHNQSRWFANLNTPEEFAEAELHGDALDT
jgi:molybdopterin-guanine dinucleotide biosynthesis protein A